MKKFTFLKLIIIIFILVGGIIEVHQSSAQAATMDAKITYSANLYKNPSSTSTKIMNLKQNAKVKLSTINSNGWAKVSYKGKTGYIFSTNLDILEKQKIRYAMNPKKIYKYLNHNNSLFVAPEGYSYMWSFGDTSSPYLSYFNKTSYVWYENNKLYNYDRTGMDQRLYAESENGMTIYFAHSEGMPLLEYPVVNNKKFYFIESIAQTHLLSKPYKVKAGTFKNVVRQDLIHDVKIYLAPNVGIIKITNHGKTTRELVSLTNQN